MSDESIRPPSLSNNNLALPLSYNSVKTTVKCNGSCSKQDRIIFTHGNIVKSYIVYEINLWKCGYDDYYVPENSLLGTVNWVKNADIDKHKYSGYGIRFDRLETFSLGVGFARNVTIFCFDVSSSTHIGNKEKDILILGEGSVQGLYDITLSAKKNIWSMLLQTTKFL